MNESQEFDQLSDITATSNAKVHGILETLSPIKVGGNQIKYFDGYLTDDRKRVRMFSFEDESVRTKLKKFRGTTDPLSLSRCELQPSKNDDKIEIRIQHHTEVADSNKKYDKDKVMSMTEVKTISLNDLGPSIGKRVNVRKVKATSLSKPETVGKNSKRKQDIKIEDESGTAKLTIWEENIGSVTESKSYHLWNVKVNEFNQEKHLTTAFDSEIEEVHDDGIEAMTMEETSTESAAKGTSCETMVENAQIVGVLHLDSYLSCINCKTRVVEDGNDDTLRRCTKCKMVQLADRCSELGDIRIMVMTTDHKKLTVRAFGSTVIDILKIDEDVDTKQLTKKKLLESPRFSFTHSEGIIQRVIHTDEK